MIGRLWTLLREALRPLLAGVCAGAVVGGVAVGIGMLTGDGLPHALGVGRSATMVASGLLVLVCALSFLFQQASNRRQEQESFRRYFRVLGLRGALVCLALGAIVVAIVVDGLYYALR